MVSSTSHLGVVRKIIFLVVISIVLVVMRNQYFTGRTQNDSYIGLPQSQLPLDMSKPQIVLIVAYMHTGSSYLGTLLQQHPKTFYLFEPLRHLYQKSIQRGPIKYLNGTEIAMSEDVYTHVGVRSLVDIFSCNYSNLDIATVIEKFGLEQSCQDCYRCLNLNYNFFNRSRKANISGANFQELHEAINTCFPKKNTNCELSNMRAIKSIRMSMEMTELVLRTIPNMRIIHLFRDPRAMLDSNHRRGEMGVDTFSIYQQRTKFMCDRMTRDFRKAEQMKVLYPGKIFTLRYEDMVEDPIGIAKNVYNFIQIPFTNVVKKFVTRISINSAKNSTIRAEKWRYHIDADHLNVVESICDDLFKMLGYKKLDNVMNVRNLTITDHEREIHIS